METYIEASNMLLTRFEFYGGHRITDKVDKARRKVVKSGQGEIVTEQFFLTGERAPIRRKK